MTIETRPSASIPAWAEAGDKVQPTNEEIQNGWQLSNIPPSRQRFNWFFNLVSAGLRYILQFGIGEWSDSETYPVNARAQYAGLTYRAKLANTNKRPDLNSAEWERWGFAESELAGRIDRALTKNVAGSSNVVLSDDEAAYGIITFTGALTGNINVVVPNAAKRWVLQNSTSGSFVLTVKTAAGAGIALPQTSVESFAVYCDGANTVKMASSSVAPTASRFDSTTQVASTAFVRGELGSMASFYIVTAAETLTAAVIGKAVRMGNGGYTVTLPLLADVPIGGVIRLKNTGTGVITIQRQGSDNISVKGDAISSFTMGVGDSAILVKSSADWSLMGGSAELSKSAVFASLLANEGYQKLPSGRIEVQGTFTASATPGAAVAVTFPLGATNCRNISLTPVSSGTSAVSAWFDTPTGTGFNGHCSVAGATVHYRAILD